MGSKSPSTLTTTTSPPASVLSNYQDVTNQAKTVAATPFQPFQGELVAGINQGQADAIGQLQGSYGIANPYLNAGSSYLNNASAGLGGVQNYLQAGSQSVAQGQQYAGLAAGLNRPDAYKQYYSPYQNNVINSTMANLRANDQIQAQGLSSNAIGSGSYGGDRAGIAQADLARQQDLADGQTIAGLQNQGYQQAVGQAQQASTLYGNLANSANQSAGLYNTLGQTQGQTASAQGALAGVAGNLGQTAQNTAIAGGSAALQGSTLQQQNQQQQDAAAYGQYQAALQYPFQTTSYLANIAEGIGANSGGSSTSPGASTLSQIVGAGTTGLGILGATGAFGSSGYLTGAGGLLSDERVKEDIEPIGKTFDGQTMYRFRYKGDDTVRTGLMAQDVEKRTPSAVSQGLGGIKAVEYGAATDKAAQRGHFARGGGVAGGLSMIPAGLGAGRSLNSTLMDAGVAAGVIPEVRSNRMPDALSSFRGAFADGGSIMGEDGGLPALSFAAPGSWGAGGLTGGVGGLGANTRQNTMGGGPGGSQMPVLSVPPSAPQSPAGLAGGFGGSTGSGGGLTGSTNSDPDTFGSGNPNLWMSVLAGGLATMAGTSPYAMANIGQGGLAGLKEYQGLRQNDREIGYKNAELGLARQKADLELQGRLMTLNGARAAAGLPPLAGLGGAAAVPATSDAASPSPGLAPSAALSRPTASSPAMDGVSSSSAVPDASQSGSVGTSSAVPVAAAPTRTDTGTNFWSGVDPESNPYVLNARARATQAYGDTAAADALRNRAGKITQDGTVLLRDGTTATIPGYIDRVAAQKAAEAQGQEAGSSHTVYDADGNALLVDGKTYQQAAKTGTINGSPVTAVQSPYNSADVDNYKEFSKNAIAFNKDYQSNKYALNSLAHIYQSYQGGRGAEAIADLDSYAKQAGLEGALPKGWQNTAAGFDAALKTVTAEGFKSLQDSGLTKAPATGLREVMLTVPRPDADPAARQKAITDALANLNYQHDMISNIAQSGDRNVLRAQNAFLNSNKFTDYVDQARAGTPNPTGASPAQLGAVMGGTPASGRQQPAAPPSVAIPRPSDLVDGQVYMTRRGPARWNVGAQSFTPTGQ